MQSSRQAGSSRVPDERLASSQLLLYLYLYRRHIKRKVLQSLVRPSHTCLLFVDRDTILGILPFN